MQVFYRVTSIREQIGPLFGDADLAGLIEPFRYKYISSFISLTK